MAMKGSVVHELIILLSRSVIQALWHQREECIHAGSEPMGRVWLW